MSSSDRRSVLRGLGALAGLPALGACGFRPVYGPGGSGTALQGRVEAEDPVNRDGFLFVAQLERRLGAPSSPRYRLSYALSISSEGLGINASASTTRYQLVGTVNYSLTDTASDTVLASGTERGFTAYSATGASAAITAASTDARERLVTILADKVVTRLLATEL